ncbi:hypothetical protein NXX09_20430 [Bacteroides uniformis]|nr:hypothetical protein [Bacteroides uniformis]
MSQPVPADVIVEEVAGIRRIVIHRDNTVSVLAGRDHLRLGGVSVSRRPFLEDSRVDELRFRDIQFIAHFEQDTPEFREPPHVVEMAVHAHILGHDAADAVTTEQREQRSPESAVHLVAVAPFAFGEVPCPGLMQGEVSGMRGDVQRRIPAPGSVRYSPSLDSPFSFTITGLCG